MHHYPQGSMHHAPPRLSISLAHHTTNNEGYYKLLTLVICPDSQIYEILAMKLTAVNASKIEILILTLPCHTAKPFDSDSP